MSYLGDKIRDVLNHAIFRSILGVRGNNKRWSKPGEIIEKMSPEDREVLQQLKSEDIDEKHLPWNAYMVGFDWEDVESQRRVSENKIDFDKKILKR